MTQREKGCPCLSAAVQDHASTNHSVMEPLFAFLLAPSSPLRPLANGKLQAGSSASISGVTDVQGAPRINGMICTLISFDSIASKWTVELPDGSKARVPEGALHLCSNNSSM